MIQSGRFWKTLFFVQFYQQKAEFFRIARFGPFPRGDISQPQKWRRNPIELKVDPNLDFWTSRKFLAVMSVMIKFLPEGLIVWGRLQKIMCVRVSVRVRPCVRTIFDPVSELETEDTSAISRKKGTKKGSKGDIWFQVRDRSRPKNNSNSVTFAHVIRFW